MKRPCLCMCLKAVEAFDIVSVSRRPAPWRCSDTSTSFANTARDALRDYALLVQGATPSCSIVFASTGPEHNNVVGGDYSEAPGKPSFHQAMRDAAPLVPGSMHVSWFTQGYDGTGAANRFIRGNITESEIHPDGGLEWEMWLDQLDALSAPVVGGGSRFSTKIGISL